MNKTIIISIISAAILSTSIGLASRKFLGRVQGKAVNNSDNSTTCCKKITQPESAAFSLAQNCENRGGIYNISTAKFVLNQPCFIEKNPPKSEFKWQCYKLVEADCNSNE